MRTAFNAVRLIEHEGEIYAINLGFDFCAEHEWGYAPLAHAFGLGERAMLGIPSRQTMPVADPEGIVRLTRFAATTTDPAETRLVVGQRLRFEDEIATKRDAVRLPPRHPDCALATAWNESGFCIRAFGARESAFLVDLAQALVTGGAVIGQARHLGAFDRGGLCVAILERIPESVVTETLAADIDAKALAEAARATGIAERLRAAGLGYFALSPRWAKDLETRIGRGERPESVETAHEVVFFLNPMEQRRFNFGWFTIEELDAWIAGRGPIVKRAA